MLMIILMLWFIAYLLAQRAPWLRARGIEINLLYALIKTRRLNPWLDKIASKGTRWWRLFFDLSIILGFVQLAFGYFWFVNNLMAYFRRPEAAAPVYPIVPGLTVSLESFVKYMLPAIVLVLVTHEFAHGISARIEGIRVRSVGLALFFIIPGAFVEPDEDDVEAATLRSKLRFFSAGSAVNIILAFLALLLIMALFTQTPSGVLVVNTLEGYPAHGVIEPYSVIIEMNGTRISSIKDLSIFMKRTSPGNIIILKVVDPRGVIKELPLRLAENPWNKSIGFMGVSISDYVPSRLPISPLASVELMTHLLWLHMLSLGVAIVNMMPIYPFDGARFVFALIDKVRGIGEKTKLGLKALMMSSALLLLVLNMILTFARM